MFDQEQAVIQMFGAGASGYLLKNSPLEEVLNAIRCVMKGMIFLDKVIDSSVFDETIEKPTTKPLLSKSESEILKLIREGKSSREIAEVRFTSVSTVEKHRKNMILKLGLSGKGELLSYAIEKKMCL